MESEEAALAQGAIPYNPLAEPRGFIVCDDGTIWLSALRPKNALGPYIFIARGVLMGEEEPIFEFTSKDLAKIVHKASDALAREAQELRNEQVKISEGQLRGQGQLPEQVRHEGASPQSPPSTPTSETSAASRQQDGDFSGSSRGVSAEGGKALGSVSLDSPSG